MASKPVFLYAAVYDDIATAAADYEAVFDLHAAGAGGLAGHFTRGIPRHGLKELGEQLENATAAVIVIGRSKLGEQFEQAVSNADKLIEREVDTDADADADADELSRELDAAASEGAKQQ